MVPAILRRLLSLLSAHRALAPLSRLTFGSTGAILMFHEVQENPDNELRTGCSPEVLDGLVRGLIAAGWDSSRWMRRSDASVTGRGAASSLLPSTTAIARSAAPALFWSDIRRRSRCTFRRERSLESSMLGGWDCAQSSRIPVLSTNATEQSIGN